ncbi:MAG: hypothetical protein AAGG09_00130 [Pseudomonadota bacterium]
MYRVRLALFALDHVAQYGIWKAGADMCGGSTRRHRADAHRNLAAQAIHAMLGRPPAETRDEAERQPRVA